MPSLNPATSAARETADESSDALELLSADHDRVQRLFENYTELVTAEADDADKQYVVEEICLLLTVHAHIEDEFFYPAARRVLDDEDVIDEAQIEHDSVRDLIDELLTMKPFDELFDDRVRLLEESVSQHVEEEENEIFPRLREAGVDLESLGEQMSARREDLMAELANGSGDLLDDD
ncbi:MAG: hemerythrin domain-containing protein [Methylibium sp.]|uniref:hemerythrin domain-containing protein n=1 Tax=Methylibium sp. TaxID=2067992 RepID=UPI00182B81C3|nr:hemerythrin domain-containing protein [Methylibium sp.]MBA3596174.1 hemerythrin domain-containing protein [Methylibium sp.]